MTTNYDSGDQRHEADESALDALLSEVLGLINDVVDTRLTTDEVARRRERIKEDVDRRMLHRTDSQAPASAVESGAARSDTTDVLSALLGPHCEPSLAAMHDAEQLRNTARADAKRYREEASRRAAETIADARRQAEQIRAAALEAVEHYEDIALRRAAETIADARREAKEIVTKARHEAEQITAAAIAIRQQAQFDALACRRLELPPLWDFETVLPQELANSDVIDIDHNAAADSEGYWSNVGPSTLVLDPGGSALVGEGPDWTVCSPRALSQALATCNAVSAARAVNAWVGVRGLLEAISVPPPIQRDHQCDQVANLLNTIDRQTVIAVLSSCAAGVGTSRLLNQDGDNQEKGRARRLLVQVKKQYTAKRDDIDQLTPMDYHECLARQADPEVAVLNQEPSVALTVYVRRRHTDRQQTVEDPTDAVGARAFRAFWI